MVLYTKNNGFLKSMEINLEWSDASSSEARCMYMKCELSVLSVISDISELSDPISNSRDF